MRYINSASLVHAIGARTNCKDCKQSQMDCMAQTLSRMDICNLVEDVPYLDIVTCGECTRYEKKNGRCNLVEGLNVATANSFCSYGERKE